MLIALTGRPMAGKDASAAVLQRAHWQACAFADALRIECAHAWGVDIRTFVDRAGKEQPRRALAAGMAMDTGWLRYVATQGWSLYDERSPRWCLQHWGEWRRQQRADHWLRPVADWIAIQRHRGHASLVITDVRHPNEAELVRRAGGHLVRVHRPGLPALSAATAAHISEQHGSLIADADIHNDGDLGHLEAEVWRVVMQLTDADTAGAAAGADTAGARIPPRG